MDPGVFTWAAQSFEDLALGPHQMGGFQGITTYPNGWGISVVQWFGSYGHEAGLWEVAIIQVVGDGFNLVEDNPIFDGDSIKGWLTPYDITQIMEAVQKLPYQTQALEVGNGSM